MSAIEQQGSRRPPSDSGMAKEKFIRVETTLYKIVEQPRLNGGYAKRRIAWNNKTLRQGCGGDYIGSVPKYNGFCTVPEHIGYRSAVGKFLNLYEPIGHRPQEGDLSYIQSLVRHIFGRQHKLGMGCLQLLYLQPIQKLPILLLVSEERNAGKSTFLNFLKTLSQNNVTFNANEDSHSQFNSDQAGKLLIVVDEVLLNHRKDSERLKNLSTTLSYKVGARGKDRDEIAFFTKFVLCSDNEHLPVIIDTEETYYWVHKINRLRSDNTGFLQKLKTKIPAFLHSLQHRKLSTKKENRMWFNPTSLHTEALQKIIRSSRNRLEIEMHELVLDIMDSVGTDTFSFCYGDILLLLVHSQVKVEKHQVRKILQGCQKLTPTPSGLTYVTYQFNCNRECRYEPIERVGRFYTVTREQLESLWHYHFSVELLNMGINTLTISDIYSQQNLDKPKEKLRDRRHPFVDFSFDERSVEKMLRGYKAVYGHVTSTAHQISKFSSTSKPYAI